MMTLGPSPAQDAAPPPAREAIQASLMAELRVISLEPPRADSDPETGRLARLSGRFETGPLKGEEAARDFLSRYSELFLFQHDLDDLKTARLNEDRGGLVVTFEEEHRGVPVFGATVLVGFDPQGAIRLVRSHYAPSLSLDTTPRLSRPQAIAAAEAFLDASFRAGPSTSRLVVAWGDKDHPGAHLAWEVGGYLRSPLGDWHLFVDAGTGEVVLALDLLKRSASPCVPCNPSVDFQCGLVFHENPVDLFDNPSLRDINNVDAAQAGCHLSHLTSAIRLDGLYANTSITSSRISPPYSSPRSASQRGVDEVTVYYHLDRAKGYLDSLGFPGVMSFSINADAHDSTLGDNSHYVPSGDYLEFGEGGVDDAQDPDIVYHEYGHAIQDNQVPGYGSTDEGGATGEGFGDYWASALTDDSAAAPLGAACVGSWDATSYNPYTGSSGTGCLRRVDGLKEYPRDFVWEVHDDGEIWSSALWGLRSLMAPAAADALIIKAHTFLTSGARFIDAADALLAADAALNSGANAAAIHGAMAARGIPRTAQAVPPGQMSLSAPFLCETLHNYASYSYKECRITQTGASSLRFHFSRLSTESGYDFVLISDGAYNQVQSLSGAPFGINGSGFSAVVPGDTIVARFKADPSINAYGFIIDQVQYAAGAGGVPEGDGSPGSPGLEIAHAPGGDILLTWGPSCSAGGTDYEIYEGVIGDFNSHVPVACTTGGLTSRTITPSAGSAYYLVVPRTAVGEGSYGTRSDGTERAPSASPCLPQEQVITCQ
jgi:hypothetical protein